MKWRACAPSRAPVHGRREDRIPGEIAVTDALVDARQVLVDNPAGAHVGVADLRVSHLAFGKSDRFARRHQLRVRVPARAARRRPVSARGRWRCSPVPAGCPSRRARSRRPVRIVRVRPASSSDGPIAQLPERGGAGVRRASRQVLLDPQQLVVLRDAIRAAGRTGLDLSGTGSHGEVRDGRVFRLAGAVRDDAGVAGRLPPSRRRRAFRSRFRSD